MDILAFDTSVSGCSVCVQTSEKSWQKSFMTERGQAEMLVPMIDELLAESGLSYAQIDRIGITTGPGSFTGLRVGLSTAKALGLSLNKPVIGITTFDVIAAQSGVDKPTLILIDTKRGDYYGQVFDQNGPVSDAKIWAKEEAEDSDMPKLTDLTPDVKVLALLVEQSDSKEGAYDALRAPQPVYLRGAEVSQSKRAIPKIV